MYATVAKDQANNSIVKQNQVFVRRRTYTVLWFRKNALTDASNFFFSLLNPYFPRALSYDIDNGRAAKASACGDVLHYYCLFALLGVRRLLIFVFDIDFSLNWCRGDVIIDSL